MEDVLTHRVTDTQLPFEGVPFLTHSPDRARASGGLWVSSLVEDEQPPGNWDEVPSEVARDREGLAILLACQPLCQLSWTSATQSKVAVS